MTDSDNTNNTLLEVFGGITTILVILGTVALILIIAKLKPLKRRKQQTTINQNLPPYTQEEATLKVIPNISHINRTFGTNY